MFGRFFRATGRALSVGWLALDVLRRAFFNLLFLALLIVVVVALLRAAPEVPHGAALVLRPTGTLVEQAELGDSLGLLRAGGVASRETVLHDLLEAIRTARDDDRIAALVLETDRMGEAGLSKLGELRAALADFKASGKPVLARGERFSQGQYYLASVADEIHLAPDGYVLLRGLARYVTYFKRALDSLGIKVHVFRVGEYKSFSEPFTRTDMSAADREASRDLLEGLWNVLHEDVAAARKLDEARLDRYVRHYNDVLAQVNGDAARAALDAGLVDRLSTRDEWRDRLRDEVGDDAGDEDFRHVDFDAYLADVRAAKARVLDRVAVLVAQGAIVDGERASGAVAGDDFARQIREAREDDRVKAVVLRIDSPGGSAWASEVIRRELELTREEGKPVIASMSSVAASGGYWIATGAEEIWAAPSTLTGSIGIFALFPVFAEPLDRLGIDVDGVATAPLAGALDPRRPLDPAAAEALQQGIEYGYQRFLVTVAEARGMSVEEVEQVARGRVWTGETAAKLGLVDQLGGLESAIAAAARHAGLERYDVVWPEGGASMSQRLLQRIAQALGTGRLADALVPVVAVPESPLGRMLAGLQAAAAELSRWNDPRHVYAHCLCEAP